MNDERVVVAVVNIPRCAGRIVHFSVHHGIIMILLRI